MDALSPLRKARRTALQRTGRLFLSRLRRQPHLRQPGLSAQARPHFQACKLRLRLGGEASLTAPVPKRPRGMHERTYSRMKHRLLTHEGGLSRRVRSRQPDYPNLVAYLI